MLLLVTGRGQWKWRSPSASPNSWRTSPRDSQWTSASVTWRIPSPKAGRKVSTDQLLQEIFVSQPELLMLHYYYSAVCLTTGPKPLPKRFLHIVRSKVSSFKWEYPLLSLRSSSSFLRLLPRLLVTSISAFIFPSITCFRRQFLRKMWPIQLAFRFRISRRILLCSLTLSNTLLHILLKRCKVEGYKLSAYDSSFGGSDRVTAVIRSVQIGSGTHLSSVQWVPGVKRPEREADNSSHLGPREWRYCSASPYLFKGVYLYLFIR